MTEPDIKATISRWILEYAYYLASNEYIEKNKIDDDICRDLIQGAINLYTENFEKTDESESIVVLLYLLCKLADGNDTSVEYPDEEEETTPLEGALRQLDTLTSQQLLDLSMYYLDIKQQAVLVYVRNNDFEKASLVFKRLFAGRTSSEERDLKRNLQEVIKAKDPAHPYVAQFSYEKFHSSMIKFIYDIQDQLHIKPPYLVAVAKTQKEEARKEKQALDKSVNMLNLELNGQDMKEMMQHLGLSSPRLSGRKRAIWEKKKANLQRNKAMHMRNIGQLLQHQSVQNISNNNTSQRILDIADSPDIDEISPIEDDNPSCSPLKKNKTRNSTSKPHRRSQNRLSGSPSAARSSSPVFKLPAKPSPIPLRKSLAPRQTPRQRAPSVNMSTVSTSSHARKIWTPLEEEQIWEGVQIHGVGKWALIKELQGLPNRSAVNIKDKWRNIVKDRKKFSSLQARLGPIQ